MTLVEVLLAATLFAMTMTGLSTHLQSSTAVWRRATTSMAASQETHAMLDQMAQDAANAVPWEVGESAGFQPAFEDHRIIFVTVAGGRLGVVGYSLEEEEGGSVLVRRWQTMPEAYAAHPGRVTGALPEVDTFSLRYGPFPRAVEVVLERGGGSGSSRARRLLVSPQGALPTAQEAG